MSKFVRMVALCVVFALFFCTKYSQALETDFHGRIQSTYVLRDTDGFQSGFLDETEGVQWRNELKFDLTLRPEYEQPQDFRVEKFFLTYRGAYDAIFDLTDRYDGVREKSPDDFELGKDDIETENDLREAFVDLVGETETQSTVLRLGRQIVQWGEADGFNVINIINPQDNSTLMFFESPDDLATPLWMARLNYSRGNVGPLHDIGLEVVAIPDIRPHQFAPLDDNMDAPYAFGFKHLKAKDLLYLHQLSAELAGFGFPDVGTINGAEALLSGFGLSDPSIKFKEDVPGSGFDNMEYGVKLQASYRNFAGALHYFHGYQDDPAMDLSEFLSRQTVTFRHPEQHMYGASFNVFLPSVNAILRGEGCLMNKVALLDFTGVNGNVGALLEPMGVPLGTIPAGTTGYVERKVYYGLIGLDKDLWIKWLNPAAMIHTSWQAYWRHINHWDYDPINRPFDEQNNYRITGFFWTDYHHGRIHPELFFMYDPEGTWMTNASVKYSKDGKLFYKITQMSFWGDRDAISPFTQPVDLIGTSEISFRVGYNW